jgi:hypothetical protein
MDNEQYELFPVEHRDNPSRPDWSYPDEAVLREVREAREEMQAAEAGE